MKKTIPFIMILAAVAVFSACKKEQTVETGKLYLHIHTNIDSTEAEAGVPATDANGRHFQLDTASFYISGVILKKADGSTVPVIGAYVLKTIDEEQYLVGDVPVGDYNSVSFTIGIDAVTNQTLPSNYNATSPLANQAMWFGSSTQGYKFINVKGLADTTAGNNGPVNVPFSYQLGTSAMVKTINMPEHAVFTVVKDGAQEVHLTADFGKLLEGVNFKTQPTATPFNNLNVATQIANNVPNMFSYEE